jgi:hypothetical protein
MGGLAVIGLLILATNSNLFHRNTSRLQADKYTKAVKLPPQPTIPNINLQVSKSTTSAVQSAIKKEQQQIQNYQAMSSSYADQIQSVAQKVSSMTSQQQTALKNEINQESKDAAKIKNNLTDQWDQFMKNNYHHLSPAQQAAIIAGCQKNTPAQTGNTGSQVNNPKPALADNRTTQQEIETLKRDINHITEYANYCPVPGQ